MEEEKTQESLAFMPKAPKIEESIGFTGTKHGMTPQQIQRIRFRLESLKRLGFIWFHHGDCLGADHQAHFIAKELGYKIALHPPLDKKLAARLEADSDYVYPDGEYLARDRSIVDKSMMLLAAPKGRPYPHSGTWYTIHYARQVAKSVYMV